MKISLINILTDNEGIIFFFLKIMKLLYCNDIVDFAGGWHYFISLCFVHLSTKIIFETHTLIG